jgi:hypothetical protein
MVQVILLELEIKMTLPHYKNFLWNFKSCLMEFTKVLLLLRFRAITRAYPSRNNILCGRALKITLTVLQAKIGGSKAVEGKALLKEVLFFWPRLKDQSPVFQSEILGISFPLHHKLFYTDLDQQLMMKELL